MRQIQRLIFSWCLVLFQVVAVANVTPITKVVAVPASLVDFYDEIEALGTTAANESVNITADTTKKIKALHFKSGEYVEQGALLVTLENEQELAELKSAESTFAKAQTDHDRIYKLRESQAVAVSELQTQAANLAIAEAEVDTIKAILKQRKITAPFAGKLGLRSVSVGTLVQPGTLITTLDDLDQIKVDFNVSSHYLADLHEGQRIIGMVRAFNDRVFNGKITTIDTQVDPVTRTIKVRSIFPNQEHLLKPGLLIIVDIIKDERKAIVIPEEALIKSGITDYVYVVRDREGQQIAEKTDISIGARKPGLIEVRSGLAAGDLVITHGSIKLRDQQPVELTAPIAARGV